MKRWLLVASCLAGCGVAPAHTAAPVPQAVARAQAAFDPKAYATEVTWEANGFFRDPHNVGKKCHMQAYLGVMGDSDFFPAHQEVWALRGPKDLRMWAYEYSYPVLRRSTYNPFNGGLWGKLGVKPDGPASKEASTIYFTVDDFDNAFGHVNVTLKAVKHANGAPTEI